MNGISLNQSILGQCVPILMGQRRIPSKLLWYGDFTSAKAQQPGGSGLGKGGTQYVYTASIIAALCLGNDQGGNAGLLSVWDSTGKFEVQSTSETYTITGPYTYTVSNASLYAQDQGTGYASSYSVSANDFGSPGSITYAGTQQVPLTLVKGTNVIDSFGGSILGPNWTINEGSFIETGNTCQISGVGGDSRANAWWNANTFSADQSSQCTIDTSVGAGAFGPAVRMSSSGETYYGFYATNANWYLFKVIAGSVTVIDTGAHSLLVGDILNISVIGTTLTGKINGISVSTQTDSSIATGQPGIAGDGTFSTSNAISSWLAESASGVPAAGQYAIDSNTGTYIFAAADVGKEITITYAYYRYNNIIDQKTIVPFSGPYVVTVDNQPYFSADEGVTYYPSGAPLTPTGGSPSVGQYNPNHGNYTFAAADAGQGIVISYSYNNPNTDNNAPTTLNMTFFAGAQGQAPWSYMTTKHPGQALGYTQVAYIASSGLYLGYSPEVPNYSYEILGLYSFGAGIVDACPSDCIQGILSDSIIGIGFSPDFIDSSLQGVTRDFWLANNFFISPLLDSQRSVSSVIGEWCEAGQVANFWSEGLMKFIPYGTTTAVANGAQYNPPTQPLYSFTDSDYITEGAQAPIKVSRSAWQDAFNKVEVQWSVRTNDYQTDVCPEQNDAAIQAFGLRLESPKDFGFICTLSAAQFAANMRVQRNVTIRNTYQFRVPSNFIWLDPMDIIEVNDAYLGLVETACRITKMTDDPQKGIMLTCEDFPWATGNPSLYPKQPTLPSSILSIGQQTPGNTDLLIIEVPSRANLYAGDILYLFATGNTPNWGGCTVWKALGTNSSTVTNVAASAGTLTVVGVNTGSTPIVATNIVTFFNTGTILDGQTVTVATASGTGFTASYSGTISSTPVSPAGSAWAMTQFQILGTVSTPARMGELTGSLAAYSSANPDTTDTLHLSMNEPSATLDSVSSAAASQPYPVTLSAVISAGPTIEFLSYETATLTSGGTPPGGPEYDLTTLYRGLMGTPGASHAAGSLFVRLDEASLEYQYDPSLVGSTIFLAATSVNAYGNQEQDLSEVAITPVFLAGSGPGSVDLSSGILNTAIPGYTTYRPLSNPLSAIDAGGSATIDIASFSMQLGGYGAIGYNSGSIASLSYQTVYYVYFDQVPPLGALEPPGGTVTYQVTTIKETAMTGNYRFFVGSILTPVSGAPETFGNNDGGTGAQIGGVDVFYFTSTTQTIAGLTTGATGTGAVANQYNVIDGALASFSALTLTGNSGANTAQIVISGLPSINAYKYKSFALKLAFSVPTNSLSGGVIAFKPQTNTGSLGSIGSWSNVLSWEVAPGVTKPLQVLSIIFTPSSFLATNFANLAVNLEAIVTSSTTSGSLEVDLNGCWLECTY